MDKYGPIGQVSPSIIEQSLQIHNDGISSLNNYKFTGYDWQQNKKDFTGRRTNGSSSTASTPSNKYIHSTYSIT